MKVSILLTFIHSNVSFNESPFPSNTAPSAVIRLLLN